MKYFFKGLDDYLRDVEFSAPCLMLTVTKLAKPVNIYIKRDYKTFLSLKQIYHIESCRSEDNLKALI